MRFFIAFVVVFALIGAAAWLVRRFGANSLGGAAARGRQPRLAVIEAGAVDGRRKLVIVRRDNVEHLIMIGGPTDILIEANIVRGQAANRDVSAARGTGAAEALARALPLDESRNLVAACARARRAASAPGRRRGIPELDASGRTRRADAAGPAGPRRAAPRAQADTLAGLAHELSRPNGGHEPAVATPRVAPTIDISAIRPMAPMLDIPAVKTPAPAPQPAAQARCARRRPATRISPIWRNASKPPCAARRPARRAAARPSRPPSPQSCLLPLLLPILLKTQAKTQALPAHRESIL